MVNVLLHAYLMEDAKSLSSRSHAMYGKNQKAISSSGALLKYEVHKYDPSSSNKLLSWIEPECRVRVRLSFRVAFCRHKAQGKDPFAGSCNACCYESLKVFFENRTLETRENGIF